MQSDFKQNAEREPRDAAALRTAIAQRVLQIGAALGSATALFYALLFAQTRAWQILAVIGGLFVGLAVLAGAYRLNSRGRTEAASTLVYVTIIIAYATGEFFFANSTTFNLLGGTLLILLVGLILEPNRLGRWVTAVGVYAAMIYLINAVEPVVRFDISTVPALRIYSPTATTVLLLLVFLQALRQFRSGTIQTRLVIAFLTVTIIPLGLLAFLNNQAIQNTLTENARQALFAVASETANSFDTLVQINLNTVRSEATIPALADYLALAAFSRGGSLQEASARSTLLALARKDPVRILSYALLDLQGIDVMDTVSVDAGNAETENDYFQQAIAQDEPFVSEVIFSQAPGGFHSIVFSSPVKTVSGELVGVLRVRYNAVIFHELILDTTGRAGEDSFGVIFQQLGDNFIHIGHGAAPETIFTAVVPFDAEVQAELQSMFQLPLTTRFGELALNLPDLRQHLLNVDSETFFTATDIATGERINEVAVLRLQTQPSWIVAFFQPQDAFLGVAAAQTRFASALVLLFAVGVTVVGVAVAQVFARPITELTNVALRVAEGDLSAKAPIQSEDEVGVLARTFNTMTERLDTMVNTLEGTVAERTAALERRASYLQAAAEVGRTAAEIYNLDPLLTQVSHLISERFGVYHVGIFLIDDTKEFAVLRAANSEGGWRMLGRGHKLRVGQEGIVGYVTGTGEPRVEQRVGEDAIYYANPDLPQTRSEMALPLAAGGTLLGALDVQSVQENAFSEEDVAVLQVLADQVAMAINNAQLFERLQASLVAERRAYGDISGEDWRELLRLRPSVGYLSDEKGVRSPSVDWDPIAERAMREGRTLFGEPENGHLPVVLPVRVRGNVVVAVLETEKPAADGPWTQEEVEVLEAIAAQMGISLENARLFEETQRLAERERLAAEVATKVRASANVDTILQTAVQELGRVLNASAGTIRLELKDRKNGE